MYDNRISVDGWSAAGGQRLPADEYGCEWAFANLDGWHGGLPVRGSSIDRPMQDGVIDGPAPLGGRTIAVGGTVWAPSRAALQAALDRISAVLAGATRVATLVVDEAVAGIARQATVRLGGATLARRTGPQSAEWSLSLFAPDPRRYSAGPARQVSTGRFVAGGGLVFPLTFPLNFGAVGGTGTATVDNAGDAPLWPVLRLTGPLVDPVIRLVGGPEIGLAMTINTGEEVVIDMATRTVLLGQASRRNFMTFSSRWFPLPPGPSELFFDAASGSGTLTVQWRDAWT